MNSIKSRARSKTGRGTLRNLIERFAVAMDPAPELSRLDRLDAPKTGARS